MTDKVKKQKETLEKKRDYIADRNKKVNKTKEILLKEMFIENFNPYLEERLRTLKEKLKEIADGNGIKLTEIEIDDAIREKKICANNVLYSAEQLNVAFEYYREFIREINRLKIYIPTKKNFCRLSGNVKQYI